MAGIWAGIGEALKEVIIALGVVTVHDKVRATSEKVTTPAGDKATTEKPTTAQATGRAVASWVAKSFEESRAELLDYFREMMMCCDKIAGQRFLDRQRMRQFKELKPYEKDDKPENHYQPGDENKFVKLMTKLFIGLSEDVELEKRKETFKWLGRMKHQEFDTTIEMLNHDVVKQMYEKAKLMMNDVGNELTDLFVKEDDRLKKMTKKLGYKI